MIQIITEEVKKSKIKKTKELIPFSTDNISSKFEILQNHINTKNYNTIGFDSFKEVFVHIKKSKSKDFLRYTLYYLFQPLFDILANNKLSGEERKNAIIAYNYVMEFDKKFLSNYYLDNERSIAISGLIKKIEPLISNITVYGYKSRNLDTNYMHASHVGEFIYKYIMQCQKTGNFPDAVIGCACGSAEIVMAIAGIFNIPFNFIRFSKRRSDSNCVIIKEHESDIQKMCTNKKVICIEDFVCTGKSLQQIMNHIKSLNAKEVTGLSVCYNDDYDWEAKLLKKEIQESSFYLYKLKE